jgi:hypothetical protein
VYKEKGKEKEATRENRGFFILDTSSGGQKQRAQKKIIFAYAAQAQQNSRANKSSDEPTMDRAKEGWVGKECCFYGACGSTSTSSSSSLSFFSSFYESSFCRLRICCILLALVRRLVLLVLLHFCCLLLLLLQLFTFMLPTRRMLITVLP